MSHKVSLQSAEDIIAERPGPGILLASGPTVPANGTPGYAPCCLFLKDGGVTEATVLYTNAAGSKTSSAFAAVDLNVAEAALLSGLTATSTELNTMHSQTMATGAGAGITDGTGTIYKNSVQLSGGIYYTRILMDLTGVASSTTDLDIIGTGTSPAYIGQVTAARNGTILGGTMTCLEAPTGGINDIDLYWATEATGKFDDAVAGLTETALITSGGAWTIALTKAIADPVGIADGYLYLTGGAAGTAATYTAGKFLLQFFGY
jgi:hypothetical protein